MEVGRKCIRHRTLKEWTLVSIALLIHLSNTEEIASITVKQTVIEVTVEEFYEVEVFTDVESIFLANLLFVVTNITV